MTDKEIIDKITLYYKSKDLVEKLEKELRYILYDKVTEGYKRLVRL